MQRGVEVVVHALAGVDGDRLEGGDVLGELTDEGLRRPADLLDRLQVVVLEVVAVGLPQGQHLDPLAVGQGHGAAEGEVGVDGAVQLLADVVAGDCLGSARAGVPDDVVAEAGVLLLGQVLDLEAGAVGAEAGTVVGEHVGGLEALEVVGPEEQGQVREALDEGFVMPLLIHDDLGHAQEDRDVRETGTHRDPVVGLGGRGAVFGRDGDDLAAVLDQVVEEMRLRHLVLDQVLAHLDVEPAVGQVVEIAVRVLDAGDEGMAGRLVAVPGVVGPDAAGFGVFLRDFADALVQEGEHVRDPVHAVLADHASEAHAAAQLEGAGTGAAHLGDHLGLVALGLEPFLAFFTAVCLGDVDGALGNVGKCLVPAHAVERVGAASIELVLIAAGGI